MGGLFDLESHLVFYRSYHFNHTNVTIHLICIPIILLSAIALLLPYQLGNVLPYLNLGVLLAIGYSTFYTLLDFKLGSITVPILVGALYFLSQTYIWAGTSGVEFTKDQFTKYALVAHTSAWLAQFYGHGVHEKRAPALLDNLLQAIVLAPFFVVFEVAFALGFRRTLKKNMDNRAGKIVRDLKFKEAEKRRAKQI